MRHPPAITQPTTQRTAQPAGPSAPASVYCHQVTGRLPGTGPVLAVLTGGPADLAVAHTAATWATGTRSLVIAATVVTGTGFSLNPLLHQVRARRQDADSLAVIDRLTPILTAAGVAWLRAIVAVPTRAGPAPAMTPALPLAAIRRLVDRFAAVAVVTATPLHDPAGRLAPLPPQAANAAITAAGTAALGTHVPQPSATTDSPDHEEEA
ncbi:hypothetical protein ACFQVD_08760 [Streptosporangium amethystogenes subsp. fukuiense]|uniref:Flavoprotein n=1 Tax=Streptosporangium amethystogenes subsp. fukuiense TaxID=698418 RepID=A0ABW2SV75_9ACTN